MKMQRPVSGWRAGWSMATYVPSRYVPGGLLWVVNHSMPVLAGLVLKAIFDRVSHGPARADSALAWIAVLVAIEVGRGGVLYAAIRVWPSWFQRVMTLLRVNLLHSLVTAPGPASTRLPASSGEAISRFRDDTEEVVWLADIWVDLAGALVFGTAAIVIMLSISPLVTLVVLLPLAAVLAVTRWLSELIKSTFRQARQSGAQVTSFIGEVFGGVLAVKVAGAEGPVLETFRRRNLERRSAAVRSQLCTDLLESVGSGSIEVTIGLVLLLAASSMRSGRFTVGDLALFTSYAQLMAAIPRWTGRMLARQKQATVSVARMARLVPEGDAEEVIAHRPVYVRTPPPPAPGPLAPTEPLVKLDVVGLTARHRSSGRGIDGIDLAVARGRFTVVTGAVGSGKTTLLRALLGLVPVESGTIRWNGAVVDDPSTFLVPPRAAYAGQVPRLFSATLEENLVLGWHEADAGALAEAIRLAALDTDVAGMADGLATMVGPRGVRLSGGQVQRATAARALVRRPELLVVDDLSSALDVETEERLWDRIAGRSGSTCLVVSHRRAALLRADHVLVLDEGRLVGAGPLDDLLRDCPEMRRLWREESVLEAEEALGA